MTEIQPMFNFFDQIRRTDSAGREHWSAREIMPHFGYGTWERFADAIERAKIAAQNSGTAALDHFRGAGKVIEGGRWGEQTVADYHLTRYACYLVAMNGDPRKPEIAAAQTYFAVKTREAELREAFMVPTTFAEALELAAHQARELEATKTRAEKAEHQVLEMVAAARMADELLAAEGDYSLRDAAQILSRSPSITIGQNNLLKYLREIGWVDRAGEPYQAQVKIGHLSRRSTSYDHPHTGEPRLSWQVRVTPKGLGKLHRLLSGGTPFQALMSEQVSA